jgi:hypothetical protein
VFLAYLNTSHSAQWTTLDAAYPADHRKFSSIWCKAPSSPPPFPPISNNIKSGRWQTHLCNLHGCETTLACNTQRDVGWGVQFIRTHVQTTLPSIRWNLTSCYETDHLHTQIV